MKKEEVDRQIILLLVIMFLYSFLGTAQGNCESSLNPIPSFFSTNPMEIIFPACQAGSSSSQKVQIYLKNDDSVWALYGFLEGAGAEELKECFSIKEIGKSREIKLSNQPVLICEGSRSVSQESSLGEIELIFSPSWTILPGNYSTHLLLSYQAGREIPTPIFSLPIEVEVIPTLLFSVETQEDSALQFEIQGPPGWYISDNFLIISGRTNVPHCRIVCTASDLVGKKGGKIPRSRIFLAREKQSKKKEYTSFEEPIEIISTQAGELVTFPVEGFYIQTLLEDLPDVYQGEIYFDFLVSKDE